MVLTDNCSNNTARRAEFAGADAQERFDLHLRGDGYAFCPWCEPLDVVVLIDADCVAAPRSLPVIATAAEGGSRGVHPIGYRAGALATRQGVFD